MHERYPTVVPLQIHLENGQRIIFNQHNLEEQLANPRDTQLTAFFKLCTTDALAKTLLYREIPEYFRWNNESKTWIRRREGTALNNPFEGYFHESAIGRVYTIHVSNFECYCLRMLLHVHRGPTSFVDLKTYENITYNSFQEVCAIRGLLENDEYWFDTLQDAQLTMSPKKIRELFAVLITSCGLSRPLDM